MTQRMRRASLLLLAVSTGLTLLSSQARGPFDVFASTTGTTPYPILFVTQVPVPEDYTTIGSVFGNHRGDIDSAPRGGDLWIRYPDGTLKNLTQAAGYGNAGFQGAQSIAVREPSVHWSGAKAIFSMITGSTVQRYQWNDYYWQLYEIAGLAPSDTPVITKVPNQPANFNNVSPIYGTDGRIIFTSDRPRTGERHLYPLLDEYETAPSTTGLWSLDPVTGDLFLMQSAPSGAFRPIVDSFGRVVFSRWDHLQRDQQADSDALGQGDYGTFNYANETASAAKLNTRAEIFPEPRSYRQDLLAGTNLAGHEFNQFFPWQVNEDGTEEETLNHVGRHELGEYFNVSLTDDPNLTEFIADETGRFNQNPIENFLQIREDPLHAGVYFGVDAQEFQTHAAGQIVSLNGPLGLPADQMAVTYITHRDTATVTDTPAVTHSGLYRNPLPLSDGSLLAVHTTTTSGDANTGTRTSPGSRYAFRIKLLAQSGSYWIAGQSLTGGLSKTISYYDPDELVTYSGPFWELDPVEVRPRSIPPRLTPTLGQPEQQVLAQESVSIGSLQAYLTQNNLALIVSHNVTTRDVADRQQPFNLRIAGTNLKTVGATGKIYDVSLVQLFQADQIRGLGGVTSPWAGRRVLAQVMHDPQVSNPPNASGVPGTVALGSDGSMAAFVPARRAMTWQLTDGAGTPVVRERYWLTFQPGEIRVCTSCHGLNSRDQSGQVAPQNPPQALARLLQYWKGGTTTPPPSPTPPPPQAKILTLSIVGSGSVTSLPPGIACGSSCGATYQTGTVVALTPAPASGFAFGGWSGHADCTDATVAMTADRSCTATFLRKLAAPVTRGSLELNGDGAADVFVYNTSTGDWSMLLNNQAGAVGVRTGVWPSGLTVTAADLNGDGFTDVFGYRTSTGAWFAYLNDARGGFTAVQGTWAPSYRIYAADLSGDGKTDLLAYNPQSGRWQAAVSKGNGTFTMFSGQWTAGMQLFQGDFNGDHLADFFAFVPNTGGWRQYVTTTAGAFRPTSGSWPSAPSGQFAIGDMNADGRSDVFLYRPGSGSWQQGFATAAGTFTTVSGVWPVNGQIVGGDLNADGRLDLWLYQAATGGLAEYVNAGAGKFTRYGFASTASWALSSLDLNADRRTDLLGYNTTTGQWSRMLNLNLGSLNVTTGALAPGLTVLSAVPKLP